MTTYQTETFLRTIVMLIDDVAKLRKGKSGRSILSEHDAKQYPEWAQGKGRVTRKFLDKFLKENAKIIGDERAAEIVEKFKAYDDYIEARAVSARKNRKLPARAIKIRNARTTLLKGTKVSDVKDFELSTSAGMVAFLDEAVINPTNDKNYQSARTKAQSAIAILTKKPELLGFNPDALRDAAIGQIAFALAWSGKQANEPDLIKWAIDRMESVKEADVFNLAAYWHATSYLLTGDDGAEASKSASLALQGNEASHYPICPNFQRAVEANFLRRCYIERRRPLSTKVGELGKITVLSALKRNVELARKSQKRGSLVVAYVTMADAMLMYKNIELARDAFLLAWKALRHGDGDIGRNAELVAELGDKLADHVIWNASSDPSL